MYAETIALGLDKPRRYGSSWMACCPVAAHKDQNPSFSITDTNDGRTLVHCFSGCSQEAVIEALREKGLWPDATPQQKHNAAQRKRREAIEHHRLILKIARSDLKKGKRVSQRDQEQIKRSIEFLRRAKL